MRQLDVGGGPGQLVERSGTFTTSGNQITFTYDCAYNNGASFDAAISSKEEPQLDHLVTPYKFSVRAE